MKQSSQSLLALIDPLSALWNLLAVGGTILLVAILALIWVRYLRRNPQRRRKRRQRHGHNGDPSGRVANPTLAQTGGLPPVRNPDPAADQRR